MKQFIKDNKIKAHCKSVSRNPNMPDWKDANHYHVTLSSKGKKMSVFFSMGLGHKNKPTVADVLDCLASDAPYADESFEDFLSGFGYTDEDRKTYNAIVRTNDRLRNFLGDSFDALIYETERL